MRKFMANIIPIYLQKRKITVDDLARQGYVINNEGVVEDPRDEEKNLNDLKIKLTKKDEEVTVKVLV